MQVRNSVIPLDTMGKKIKETDEGVASKVDVLPGLFTVGWDGMGSNSIL
jgi:hypothetical protein